MRKIGAVLVLISAALFWAVAQRPGSSPPPPPFEPAEPAELQAGYRLLIGSPRLRAGEYRVELRGPGEAQLRSRPYMGARLESMTEQGAVWSVSVPSEAPYGSSLEGTPNQPVSGLLFSVSEKFSGRLEIQVGEESVTFSPSAAALGTPLDLQGGFLRVEKLPPVLTLAATDWDEDYPALLTGRDGALTVAWTEFDGRSDRLRVVRRTPQGGWMDLGYPAGPADIFQGRLAETEEGLWLVWAEQREGNWDLLARVYAGGQWSEPARLTTGPFPDWNHELAADSDGALWLVWQGGEASGGGANSEIYLAVRRDRSWSAPLNISRHPANDWEPALELRGGSAWIAWDSYRFGSYDVLLARSDGRQVEEPVLMAGSPRLEARPDLAFDHQGRLWCSWEEEGPEWGKDSAAFDRGLHRDRTIRLRCLQGSDLLEPSEQPLSPPLPHLGPQAERARLATDAGGRLWLFFRVNFLNRIWQQAALYLDGSGWSEPLILDPSNGRQAAPLAVAADGEGLLIAWPSDTRAFGSFFAALHNDIQLSRLLVSRDSRGGPSGLRPAPAQRAGETASPERSWPAHNLQAGNRNFRLLWGELHRHTDIDHHGRPDGSLEDAYRYAVDAAQMDFFAATDHISGRPDQSGINPMTWWRSQKYADLHRFPAVFEPLYAYERSKLSPGGHKNLIFARRGGPLLKGTEGFNLPTDLWADLDRAPFPVVVIPHQLTGPAISWSQHNPRYESVMEIYQGRRQSYEYDGSPQPPGVEQKWGKAEGSWAWDALARGLKMGFIASSDHSSTHMSYAAVYAAGLNREAVLEALQARRTYAASDNIVLDFRLDTGQGRSLLMGESGPAGEQVRMDVRVIGTGPIERIEVIQDNRFVYTHRPGTKESTFRFAPTERIGGNSYFYIRVVQEDGHLAWSSPIWLEAP